MAAKLFAQPLLPLIVVFGFVLSDVECKAVFYLFAQNKNILYTTQMFQILATFLLILLRICLYINCVFQKTLLLLTFRYLLNITDVFIVWYDTTIAVGISLFYKMMFERMFTIHSKYLALGFNRWTYICIL